MNKKTKNSASLKNTTKTSVKARKVKKQIEIDYRSGLDIVGLDLNISTNYPVHPDHIWPD